MGCPSYRGLIVLLSFLTKSLLLSGSTYMKRNILKSTCPAPKGSKNFSTTPQLIYIQYSPQHEYHILGTNLGRSENGLKPFLERPDIFFGTS